MIQEKTSKRDHFLDGGTVYFSGVKQDVSYIQRSVFWFRRGQFKRQQGAYGT